MYKPCVLADQKSIEDYLKTLKYRSHEPLSDPLFEAVNLELFETVNAGIAGDIFSGSFNPFEAVYAIEDSRRYQIIENLGSLKHAPAFAVLQMRRIDLSPDFFLKAGKHMNSDMRSRNRSFYYNLHVAGHLLYYAVLSNENQPAEIMYVGSQEPLSNPFKINPYALYVPTNYTVKTIDALRGLIPKESKTKI